MCDYNEYFENDSICVGLVAGRHDLPVDEFVWDKAIADPTDFEALQAHADAWVESHCDIGWCHGAGLDQESYEDIQVRIGRPVMLYVTGLTACTTAMLWACAKNGVALRLMHFDRATGEYVPQDFVR